MEKIEKAIEALSLQLAEATEALKLLCEAKHIKEKFGKGVVYEQLKERGWAAGEAFLEKINNQPRMEDIFNLNKLDDLPEDLVDELKVFIKDRFFAMKSPLSVDEATVAYFRRYNDCKKRDALAEARKALAYIHEKIIREQCSLALDAKTWGLMSSISGIPYPYPYDEVTAEN